MRPSSDNSNRDCNRTVCESPPAVDARREGRALESKKATGTSDDTMPSTCRSRANGLAEKLNQYGGRRIRVNMFIEVQLLLLTFSTGVQDADSLPNFRCFASNQTGNTVILAIGISGYKSDLFDLHNVGVSLAMFVSGAIITGQLANWLGRRRRAWQIAANFSQAMMVLGAACIQFARVRQNADQARQSGPWALAAIALLAFSSGAQVASAREMQIPEITTAMATAAWVDLVIDPRLISRKNHSRNRRLWFLVALVSGSFIGALLHIRLGSSWALLVSGSIKAAVTAMIVASRTEHDQDEGNTVV